MFYVMLFVLLSLSWCYENKWPNGMLVWYVEDNECTVYIDITYNKYFVIYMRCLTLILYIAVFLGTAVVECFNVVLTTGLKEAKTKQEQDNIHPVSSNSNPLATASIALHCLKRGGRYKTKNKLRWRGRMVKTSLRVKMPDTVKAWYLKDP